MAFWSVKTLAEQLDISPRLAQRLVADGSIPSIRFPAPSRSVRVNSTDAVAWATSRTKENVDEGGRAA
jgi:hypothetical protein